MNAIIGVSGKFKISVIRDGSLIHSTEFQNLILDRFLSRWANGTLSTTVQCVVGTGTTAPTETDTTLTSQIGAAKTGVANVASNYKTGSDYFASTRYTFTYSVGEITATIGEVGVSFGTISSGLIDTKTLIKDPAGNPTTVTLTAADQLVIEYYMIQKMPTSFGATAITVNGTAVSCTVETMNILNSSVWPIWVNPADLYYTKGYMYAAETLHGNVETGKLVGSGFAVAFSGHTGNAANAYTREISFPIGFSIGNIPGGSFNYIMFIKTVTSVEYPTIGILFSPSIVKNLDVSLSIKLQFAISRM